MDAALWCTVWRVTRLLSSLKYSSGSRSRTRDSPAKIPGPAPALTGSQDVFRAHDDGSRGIAARTQARLQ